MANDLTGDFDAVVEVSVNAINAILATLHQNEPSEENDPGFLHSFALRVGDPPKLSFAHIAQVQQWLVQLQGGGEGGSAQAISDKAPPGASADINDAITKAQQEAQDDLLITPAVVRGLAQVQLSTPTVSFPSNSTAEVTAHVDLRARFRPDPHSLVMPEFIHGEVQVTLSVSPPKALVRYRGGKLLEVSLPSSDSKIQFIAAAGAGLDGQEVAKIETALRTALRRHFEPMNVALPAGFQFTRFKALGSGGNQALALPVQLSDRPQPAINSVNNPFLDSSDAFAIAVSKEHILSLVQPSLDALKATHPQFSAAGAVYTVTFDVAAATWVSGKIRIDIQGHANTPAWWAPNVSSFNVAQDLALELHEPAQTIDVVPVGQPSVSVNVNGPLGGLIAGLAQPIVLNQFATERDKALAAAQSQIQQALSGGGNINDALKSFDKSAHARLKGLDTTGAGLILRGAIATSQRPQPVVEFTETGDGTAFTALQSWIPGGKIEQFEWSWVEKKTVIPWEGTTHVAVHKHRFILPKTRGLPQVCLRVVGKHVFPGQLWGVQALPPGGWVSVEGGDTCKRPGLDLTFTMPSWWDKLMIPIWMPDPPPDGVLEEAIAGHVDVLASSRRPGERGANSVVHFADLQGGSPLQALDHALSQHKRRDAAITLVLVLPRATFRNSRAAVEEQLGALRAFSGSLLVTEDYEGGWARTFGTERPATYLVNARGEFVWKHAGALEAPSFAAALDQHLMSGPAPEAKALRMAVRPGKRALDVLLQAGDDDRLALRRLQGRPVLLNFWQSWSAPCLRELRHLQGLHREAGRDRPVVIAINGGEAPERVAEVCRKHELTLTVVHDLEQRIARRYGVSCWPTTVSINADGIVDRIQFGITRREHRTAAQYESTF
jgi:peroxiredoxin